MVNGESSIEGRVMITGPFTMLNFILTKFELILEMFFFVIISLFLIEKIKGHSRLSLKSD